MMKRILFFAFLIGFTGPLYAATPSDFDADGISDRVWIDEASDGSLTWKASGSATNTATTIGTLGMSGDEPVMAQWLGIGTQIGIVAADTATDTLKWSILGPNATRMDRTFGKPGDLVVAGADFNGNGTADAAVVRLVGGKATWEFAYDLFMSESPSTVTSQFGKAGDRVFFARVDDSAVDWIGVMRKGNRNRSNARMRNMVTGQARQFSRLPKFASSGARPRAFPIRQASGADLLGFQVEKAGITQLLVYNFGGTKIASELIPATGIVAVGDFTIENGYEVAFQSDQESVIVNPYQGELREVSNLGGTPVDEVSIAVRGEASSSDSNDSGAGGGTSGGGSDSSGGGSLSQCSSVTSWPGGHIYKIIGSEHFFDVRRNTIGIVVKPGGRGPFPGCVDAIDTKGTVIAKLGLYARGAGWEARYYAGVGCGTGTPFNGTSVAAKARANTGSSRIYMNFGGVCYGPIEASQCIGSKQC
jgi:uncharacterized membrane protein YgcG